MKLRHIIRYLLFIPLFLLFLAPFGSLSRAAMAREGKRPPLPAISTDIDIVKKKLSTESYHLQSAETHSSRSTRALKPSRFGPHLSHRPSSIGVHQRSWAAEPSLNQLHDHRSSSLGAYQQPHIVLRNMMAEEPSLNKINLQHVFNRLHNSNQFLNLLLMAAILLQFGDTLASQRSSTKTDVPTGSSSPVQGSNVEGKGQISENSGLEQALPESSAETGAENKLTNDSAPKRDSPVWIEFEPWLGSWIEINKGDQFVATYNFNFHRFKIERGKVGSVVKIDMEESIVPDIFITKSVIFEFQTDSLISGWDFSEAVEEIDATRPTPFPISPFLLLPKKVSVSEFKWDGNNPIEKLVREGRHTYRYIIEDPKTCLV